jgi:hypothetical protein
MQADRQLVRQTGGKTDNWSERQLDSKADIQAGRQLIRKTIRQLDRHTTG